MRRRTLLAGLTLAAGGPCLATATAQGRAEVGWLAYGDIGDPNWSAFVFAMRRLGWREETNLSLVPRFAQTAADLAASAHELLSRDLNVLVTVGVPATRLAQQSATRLPIVFGSVVDATGNGIIANPNRPEGNLTGVVFLNETVPKLIELARELRPESKAIAHLFEPAARGAPIRPELASLQSEAASRLGFAFREFPISSFDDVRSSLDVAAAEGFDTMIADNAGLLQYHRVSIVRYALDRRMAPIGRERLFATAGGLASFGEDGPDLYRRVAAHVDKILKGTPIREIPIEQASKFELVINSRTAKALSIQIPLILLARADEVIE